MFAAYSVELVRDTMLQTASKVTLYVQYAEQLLILLPPVSEPDEVKTECIDTIDVASLLCYMIEFNEYYMHHINAKGVT